MKILILATKFYHVDGSLWLTSELANELSNKGHSITVINIEWSNDTIIAFPVSEKIKLLNYQSIRINIPYISVALRWALSSLKTLPFLIKSILKKDEYDLLIKFSPCTTFYSAIPFAKLLCRRSILVYWDFFPIHNQEISKKIPDSLVFFLKYLEKILVHSFDEVGCMSPANVRFYKKYFGISLKQNVKIIPIWTSITSYSSNFNIKKIRDDLTIGNDSIVVIFGGQLIQGRGIIELCQAVIIAHKNNDKIKLIICGSGSLISDILFLEKEYPAAIKVLGFIKREKYLDILCASDIGIVSTVAGVSAPSYPSKSLDYMACGLPILAAVENASDFGEIAEAHHFGISCPASDISAMAAAIIRLASDEFLRKKLGENGKIYLKSMHDISKIAKIITGERN